MKAVKFLVIAALLAMAFKGADKIPPLNQKVKAYIKTVIGKQVDRGECWDLAAAALAEAGAFLDRTSEKTLYVFGEKINPKKDVVYPGDIIQFEEVALEYQKGNTIYKEFMPHHTAIVYEVLGEGHYQLAHQNTSFSGRKVGLSEFKLENVKKGKLMFYRPVRK